MGMLTIGGDVPWEWLAGCRACDRVHELRTEQPGAAWMTWACPRDGHLYQPRLSRDVLDALMVEHRAGQDPPTTSARLRNPPVFHVPDSTWTRLPDDGFEVHHEIGGMVRVQTPVPVRIRRVGSP